MFQKFVFIPLLIYVVSSLTYKLNPQENFCMTYSGGKAYHIEYITSGVNQKIIKMTVQQDEVPLIQKNQMNDVSFSINTKPGNFDVCFTTSDDYPKIITFDIYPEDDPLKAMIEKKDLMSVGQAIKQATQQLKQIQHNQKYHIERDQIHKIILEQSENRIKWAGIIKILFLLGSAAIQLWIMKGFFKQTRPYQPVSTN